MRTAQINIDTVALNNNIEQINQLATTANMMIMLKADAYGHGIEVCAKALMDNDKVQAVGVACVQAALILRALGWHKTIVLIEGVFSFAEWQTAIEYQLQSVIHHQQQLDWALQSLPKQESETSTIWLKFNTGMNRLGFVETEVSNTAKLLTAAGYGLILTSHFANADEKSHPLNQQQGAAFQQKLTELRQTISSDIQGSLCNSAGIVNFPEWHYDWVRAGIMAYGSSPVSDKNAAALNLQPVMSLSAKVIAIHDIEKDAMVGYGSRWQAPSASKIAIVSVGYGDGYPRVVDNNAFVLLKSFDNTGNVHSLTCPIVGRVAMDMLVIDITHVAAHHKIHTAKVAINDEVVLWGSYPHIDTVAESANTISYELLCRLTTRPDRVMK